MEPFVPSHSASVDLAEALLRAWIRGDRLELENEIHHASTAREPANGAEDEKLELLKSVAERMLLLPNLFASRDADPQLDLCLDLLVHLAACQATPCAPAPLARQAGMPAARPH